MGLFNKHFWKFFAGLAGLLAIGSAVIYATNFYANYKAQENAAAKLEQDKR